MAESQIGVVLIVLGVVFLVAGGLLPFFLGPLCGVGFLLLIIGVILMAATPSAPAYAPYPYPYAAPAPAAGPTCPTCGSALAWIAQYNRWYCYRCQQYR